jgi:hypothetical protein
MTRFSSSGLGQGEVSSGSITNVEILDHLNDYQFLGNDVDLTVTPTKHCASMRVTNKNKLRGL